MYENEESFPVPAPLPFQTPGEEIANSILHGLGVLLAVAGLVLLCLRADGFLGGAGGGGLAVTSYVIFTASMITMFLASTLYHAIQAEGAKRVFRIIDHCAIYFLIAGTYTPYSLLGFRGALGWVYFGIEWGLAAVGISLYAANVKFIKKVELVVYILMGWACVLGLYRLVRSIPFLSTFFLLAGGLAYTLGTLWYSRGNRRGAHVVWHAFVLAGAVLHWWSIWFLS
ncbi:MAG: hemolysin III family protein [Treponema sp.]|jgi:hemolysin III|nr:hemolysin III family protein [Treponema sp.]